MSDDEFENDDFEDEVPLARPARPRPPRVWTVFVACAIALAVTVGVQIVAVVAYIAWQAANGADVQKVADNLQTELATPAGLMAMASLSQLTILAAALVPGYLSPEPTHTRLGLVRPNLPVLGYPVVAVGTLPPFAIGMGFAYLLSLVIPPDPTAELVYQQMTPEMAVPFVLFIALAPGIAEELFFRGYVQRRLLQRWSPAWAILVTSALFGGMHVMPHTVVFAFVVGLWLGVVAWKTGSIWPGAVCHAFINGGWNVLHVGEKFGWWPEEPSTAVVVVGAVVTLACFLGSLWLLFGRGRETEPVIELE